MSSDIYAVPDLSKKVRYSRNVQEDNVGWEEREVDIYESADATGDDHTHFPSHAGGPRSEKHPPANQRSFSAVAFCLGVLCFLMITGIILLSIYYILVTLEKDQLQTRYEELHNNYSQLQGRVSDMAVNNSQLQSRYETLSKNNSQLQSRYETLSKNNSQLQDEVKQLKGKTEGKWCPEGWRRFGCSCYFKSNQKKTWSESRGDCQSKGADLVTINNKEEQKFVTKLNVYGESWIGLQEKWTRTTGWEWEWVDGSLLTEKFWAAGSPQQYQYAAACCDQQGKWTQGKYSDSKKNWICEKKISCIL